jgi:hypothetical protein
MGRRLVLVVTLIACALAVSLAACGRSHKITVDAEDYCVESCPRHAKEGEVVQVLTCDVCDADLYVSVDDDKEFEQFTSSGIYEFTMPDHDVCVRVWVVANGLA